MLSMVNVNRYILKVAVPTLIVGYAVFLVWERSNWNFFGLGSIAKQHYSNIVNYRNLDGIILGGSNAVFSLSAAKLGELSGDSWYNAALIAEGYSDSNYQNFISRLAQSIDATKVSNVVYSTFSPFLLGAIDRRNNYRGSLFGTTTLTIRPKRSAFSYLNEYLIKGKIEPKKPYWPLPLSNGDFNFAKFDCRDVPAANKIKFEGEDVRKASQAIYRRITFYTRLFPNANLIVVFPSSYYGESFSIEESAAYNDKLRRTLSDKVRVLGEISFSRVTFVSQPPFPKSDYICNLYNHANRVGREWRTRNLFEQLE